MYCDLTARRATELYLERIDRLNPALRAYRTVRREAALAEADAADARLRAGDHAPLLGVPIAIKDNLAIAGELTTHGTSLIGEPARADCEAVKRLRAAGAVILGITNMPELALWGHDTSSPANGATRNPHDATRGPGGSSGGSAAAVAAGLAAAAIGTDGGGSIRIPAACCGLVGLKPQRDRLPLAPDDGHWLGLSHLGPIARTVHDAALLADVLGANGLVDAARTDPRPLRIAVSFKPALPCKLHPEMRAATERTVAVLAELGHTTVERDPDYGDIRPLFVPRYARGAYLDSQRLGGPNGLEPRARSIVRIGKHLGKRADRAVAQGGRARRPDQPHLRRLRRRPHPRDRGAGAAARPGRPPQRHQVDPQQHSMGRLHAAVEPHRPARDGDPRRARRHRRTNRCAARRAARRGVDDHRAGSPVGANGRGVASVAGKPGR